MTLASGNEPNDFLPRASSEDAEKRLRENVLRFFVWLSSNGPVDPPEVRERLLQTITDKKAALVVSALAVGFTATTAGILTGAVWPFLWLIAELLLDGVRLSLIGNHERASAKQTDRSFALLFSGGFLWTLVLGCGLLGCVASGSLVLSVMAGIIASGSLGVGASRNAAAPRYTSLVIWTLVLLFVIGCVLSPEPKMLIVACQVPLAAIGLQFILARNYDVIIRLIHAELANRKLALTDRMTGLQNRLSFEERLERMTEDLAGREPADGFVLLYLDLDGFKDVNDSFGHAVGDSLLKTVSRRLVYAIRNRDNVYRLGGDEFAIILPGTSAQDAAFVAKRILVSISRPFDLGVGKPIAIGTSIGSVRAPEDGVGSGELIENVDRALYAAKDAGRGIHLECSATACLPKADTVLEVRPCAE